MASGDCPPRDRIAAALDFRPVDVVPLRILPAPGGLYDHGRKLLDLFRACGHDFGDFADVSLPAPPAPADFDGDGAYHAVKTDEWGTTWEYRIFGVWGHPSKWPLADMSSLATYTPPAPPPAGGPAFSAEADAARVRRERFYHLGDGGSIFEKMHSTRRFEDVLMDLALDTPEINRLADMIADNVRAWVDRSLKLGADAIAFGDDFGTETAMMMSPAVWRRFFKPRYRDLFEPVKRAGKKVFFHSCGLITEILPDLREIGVDVIWPQITLFDWREFAARLRDLHLAVELHPDRGPLMQLGSPAQIRSYVRELVEAFDSLSGGSILYLEIDPGFPWANVEALFETAMDLRAARPAPRPTRRAH